MKRILKSTIKKVFGKHWNKQILNFKILANKYDQLNSIKKWESKIKKDHVPWYTYPAIEYIQNFNLKDLTILEYGSGSSTLFYSHCNAKIIAVEDNLEWYKKISEQVEGSKITIKYTNNRKSYVRQDAVKSSDIIVVDGSYRIDCCQFIIELIENKKSDPYWIIIDNSDRYPEILNEIDNKLNWHRVDFCGFGPINSYTWVTSIYLNPSKKIRRKMDQIHSIAGIEK